MSSTRHTVCLCIARRRACKHQQIRIDAAGCTAGRVQRWFACGSVLHCGLPPPNSQYACTTVPFPWLRLALVSTLRMPSAVGCSRPPLDVPASRARPRAGGSAACEQRPCARSSESQSIACGSSHRREIESIMRTTAATAPGCLPLGKVDHPVEVVVDLRRARRHKGPTYIHGDMGTAVRVRLLSGAVHSQEVCDGEREYSQCMATAGPDRLMPRTSEGTVCTVDVFSHRLWSAMRTPGEGSR